MRPHRLSSRALHLGEISSVLSRERAGRIVGSDVGQEQQDLGLELAMRLCDPRTVGCLDDQPVHLGMGASRRQPVARCLRQREPVDGLRHGTSYRLRP